MRKTKTDIYKIDGWNLISREETYTTDCVKYYFNAQHKFIQLKPVARAYFDFICEQMDVGNFISLKPRLRADFNKFCKKVGLPERTDSSLRRIKQQLKNLYLIIPYPENKKHFMVNPRHVFRGTEDKRAENLKYLGSRSYLNEDVARGLLSVPYDSLKPSKDITDLPLPEGLTFGADE